MNFDTMEISFPAPMSFPTNVCSRDCQVAHWPIHKMVCAPDKQNRRIMKKLQKAGFRVMLSAAYNKVRKHYPLHTLTMQYVGVDINPTTEYLQKEMHVAMVYAERLMYRVVLTGQGAPVSQPSSVIRGVLLPTPETRRSFGDYMELISWVGRHGTSLTAGVGLQK